MGSIYVQMVSREGETLGWWKLLIWSNVHELRASERQNRKSGFQNIEGLLIMTCRTRPTYHPSNPPTLDVIYHIILE